MTPRKEIIVVDDENDVRQMLRRALERESFTVREASNGRDALQMIREQPPSLILLDMGLPDIYGLDVCSAVKGDAKISHIPIVVLTGETQAGLNVTCLELGADDFLTKPCNMKELVARINAVMRRAFSAEPRREIIERGDVKVDLARRCLEHKGRLIDNFTPKEFDILCHLVDKSPAVISRDDLALAIWGVGLHAFQSRTIDVHVLRIRQKMGPELAARLNTVSGAGYKFA